MTELIFKGKFETNNESLFIEKIEKIMEDTNTVYAGRILKFNVKEYNNIEENEGSNEN